MPRISVVEASAEVGGESVFERFVPGQRRSPGGQPKSRSGRLRERNFQFHTFAQSEGIRLQLVHIGRRMNAQNVFVRGGLRQQEIAGLRDPFGEKRLVDQSEFFRGENVRSQVQIVLRVIND